MGKLQGKTLALFFTARVSLKKWHEIGMIDREVALYNELAKDFKRIYFFTYGVEDLRFASYLAHNIKIIPKTWAMGDLLYSLLMPFIHWRVLRDADILKTNQMFGAWSAVIAKLIYRKRLIVRTGNILSIQFAKRNPNSRIKWLMRVIERVVYSFADAIIGASWVNLDYVIKNYPPCKRYILIPNYVETDVFRPMNITKKKGAICFVGKSSPQKNLIALLEALRGLPYSLSIIGVQAELLEVDNQTGVKFLGNVPNHKLPEILNQHELFILPSLWESGHPKALLEAMACGLPVIGTDVPGINSTIKHRHNGFLCGVSPQSIREAIIAVLQDEELKTKMGRNARQFIVQNYGLGDLSKKELELMEQVLE